MPEKTSAEVIVEKLDETKSQVQSLAEKTTEEMKSIGAAITSGLKEAFENKSKEEIKSLKDEMANKDEELKALRSGHGVNSASADGLEIKSAISKGFAEATTDNSFKVTNIKSFLEQKSNGVVGFDARRGGIFLKEPKVYGEVINLSPRAQGISSLIRNVDAMSDVIIKRKDYSKSEILQVIENQVSTNKKGGEYTEIKISQIGEKVTIPVTSDMLREIKRNQLSFDLVSNQINDLVDLYRFKKDKLVVDKAIAKAQLSGALVRKSLTNSASATDSSWGFADIIKAYSAFPQFYRSSNVVFAADQNYLDKVFAKVASDGHGNMEYFNFTNESGFTSLKTANGTIKLVPVDGSFFNGYKLFDDSLEATNSLATGGFNFSGSDNGGKVLGMFIDLNKSMLLSEDLNAFEVGLYSDAKDLHKEEAFFGLSGSYGTDVILEASMSFLVQKNS